MRRIRRSYDHISDDARAGRYITSDEQMMLHDYDTNHVCPDCGTVGAMASRETYAEHKRICPAWQWYCSLCTSHYPPKTRHRCRPRMR